MSIASNLKERVRIEKITRSEDGYGGQTQAWALLATVFAQVQPVYAAQSERRIADQMAARSGYRIILRRREDLDASMRLIWKNRVLLIHSIHEQNETLSILTYEENI